MPTADDASTQAAAALRLRTTADARALPGRARATSLSQGRDRVVAALPPEDVSGAILASRIGVRELSDGTRIVALGDLIDTSRSLLAGSIGSAPTPGPDGEMVFAGAEALVGAGADAAMDQIVPAGAFLIFVALRVDVIAAASTAETCAGIVSDGDSVCGIGYYTSAGATYLVGWLGSYFTSPVEIALATRYRVELELDYGTLTLRVRSTTYLGVTGTVSVVGSPALATSPIVIGEAHGEGLVGALAYVLVCDGTLPDRELRGHRYWADALWSDVLTDALLLEDGYALLLETGDRLLLE